MARKRKRQSGSSSSCAYNATGPKAPTKEARNATPTSQGAGESSLDIFREFLADAQQSWSFETGSAWRCNLLEVSGPQLDCSCGHRVAAHVLVARKNDSISADTHGLMKLFALIRNARAAGDNGEGRSRWGEGWGDAAVQQWLALAS